MDIKLANIIFFGFALSLIMGCKDIVRGPGTVKTGKAIPVSIIHKTPLKIDDTLWINFKFSNKDMVGTHGGPTIAFKDYDVLGNINISYIDGNGKFISKNIGEYTDKDLRTTNKLIYNSSTLNYEFNQGFIPNKRGLYQVQLSGVSLSGEEGLPWTLPLYYLGEDPRDHNRYRKIVVE